MKRLHGITVIACLALLAGCAGNNAPVTRAPATKPVTEIDPEQATPQYWLSQPGTSWVRNPTYDALYRACQQTASDYQFPIDRREYRDGVLTTKTMVSAQFFEPWRQDVQTGQDVAMSSLATHRRSIRFEIERQHDGSYEMTPKVLVERESLAERRISNGMYFRNVSSPSNAYGSKETDEGTVIAVTYWYAVGRDHTLERSVAASVWKKLHPTG